MLICNIESSAVKSLEKNFSKRIWSLLPPTHTYVHYEDMHTFNVAFIKYVDGFSGMWNFWWLSSSFFLICRLHFNYTNILYKSSFQLYIRYAHLWNSIASYIYIDFHQQFFWRHKTHSIIFWIITGTILYW